MSYEELIDCLGKQLKLENFKPDAAGLCQLISEQAVITIQNCPAVNAVLVTAPMARLSEGTAPGLLRKLLAANFMYAKTKGATISLDDASSLLYLARYDFMSQLDGDIFCANVIAFATTLLKLQQAIADFLAGDPNALNLEIAPEDEAHEWPNPPAIAPAQSFFQA